MIWNRDEGPGLGPGRPGTETGEELDVDSPGGEKGQQGGQRTARGTRPRAEGRAHFPEERVAGCVGRRGRLSGTTPENGQWWRLVTRSSPVARAGAFPIGQRAVCLPGLGLGGVKSANTDDTFEFCCNRWEERVGEGQDPVC